MFSRIFSGPTLIKWREPNAYIRRNLSHGRWIGLLIILSIPDLLLLWSGNSSGFSRRTVAEIVAFSLLPIVGFPLIWFGLGPVVCLKEDHIAKANGNAPPRSYYKNMESCTVRHEVYQGVRFCVLSFMLKRGLPVGQLEETAVPEDATGDQVLQILRDHGVKILEVARSVKLSGANSL
jgi:hypothetical protein